MLDEVEFAEIMRHPVYGEELLKHIKHFKEIIPGVKCHHERYDGKGYPERLKGEEINLMARVIAVADAFDAMVSDRPYRKGLDVTTAVEELKRNAGTQFDPMAVEAFCRV